VLDNQWASTKDVMSIARIGKNQAQQIKCEIKSKLEQEEYFLPKNLVLYGIRYRSF